MDILKSIPIEFLIPIIFVIFFILLKKSIKAAFKILIIGIIVCAAAFGIFYFKDKGNKVIYFPQSNITDTITAELTKEGILKIDDITTDTVEFEIALASIKDLQYDDKEKTIKMTTVQDGKEETKTIKLENLNKTTQKALKNLEKIIKMKGSIK